MQKHLAKTVLSEKRRAALPAGAFVFPRERRFPIHDLYHGRLALIYVLSPSHAASRDAVVETVLARYPQLASFWRQKSANLTTRSKSMRIIENPYGIDLPRGKKAGRIGLGEATHIIVGGKTPHALCRSNAATDAVYPSKAKKITCYRCIKLNAMNAKKGTITRYMRSSDREKRLKHVMIEGGREGQFIGQRIPKIPQRALLGPRQTAFGPHGISGFEWGGLPQQRGQGPTQTRFSDGTDIIKKTPLDPKVAAKFIEAIQAKYAGQFAKVANPARALRSAKASDAVTMSDLGPDVARRYLVQFKGEVFAFRSRDKAEEAIAAMEMAVRVHSPNMIRAALRAAKSSAARSNPAAARRASSGGRSAQGGFARGDVTNHPAYFAGYDAARRVHESGDRLTRMHRRASADDSGFAMISFADFMAKAKRYAPAPRSADGSKAYQAGVEAVYYTVKPYLEQAYGDIPSPRLNGKASVRAKVFAIIMALGLNPNRISPTDMHMIAQEAHVSVQDVRKTLAA
jgi:hypothetical protein